MSGVKFSDPSDPPWGPHIDIGTPQTKPGPVYLRNHWMDFQDLKVILGVFHHAEPIYDTLKTIQCSFK